MHLYHFQQKKFEVPLETHSKPKDPIPAYKSKTLIFLNLNQFYLNVLIILKIFSLTLSLKVLFLKFLGKFNFLFLKFPLIILIFF